MLPSSFIACFLRSSAYKLQWVVPVFILAVGGSLFSGCDGMNASPQDATLASFPRWVQGVFQLPLGASQGFVAVQLNNGNNATAEALLGQNPTQSITTIPGLSMLTQLMGYAQQTDVKIEPFAYWLMLKTTAPVSSQLPTDGSLMTHGVWILSTKGEADASQTTALAKTLGFMEDTTQALSQQKLSRGSSKRMWHQPAHQIWMMPYPENSTPRLLFASSQAGLLNASDQLKQASSTKGRLLPEARLKLIHGLETLYGSATVPATAGIIKANLLVGMPSDSRQWQRFDAGKKFKAFKLPWQKTEAHPLKHSWTLLAVDRKKTGQPNREQCHMEFVTPLYTTSQERKGQDAQWLDFIFGSPNTQALHVSMPAALNLRHVNELVIAAIEADAMPQLKQQLSMVKPVLGLMQLDFNRDVLGLFAGETWLASPVEKEGLLILQKTPTKQTSMHKWIQHLSGKSWLSKILFDGKLQHAPILASKPLADGSGIFWEIHLPTQSKNLIVSKLPPMGLLEVDHAFVIAPVKQLAQKGILKTLNQQIQPKVVVPLQYEPFLGVQLDTTQPQSAWLLKSLNQTLTKVASRKGSATTPVMLEAGKLGLLAGYQPSRGSARGQFDVDITAK
jgi:hypothetical protein